MYKTFISLTFNCILIKRKHVNERIYSNYIQTRYIKSLATVLILIK